MKLLIPILIVLFAISAQVYVSYRIWHILPVGNMWKTAATLFYNLALLSMFVFFGAGFTDTRLGGFTVTKIIYEVGTSTLFILLYLFMIFVAIDILRCVHILPKDFVNNSLAGSIGVTSLMLVLFIGGNIHYHHKYRETIDLTSTKPLKRPLKLVMLSDLHLGYHNERAEFAKWVDLINKEEPDLVLLGGDVVDFNTVPLLEQHVAEEFHRIKAPIYACLGNHEFLGGKNNADNFYKTAGINLLIDETAVLPELGVCLIGRDDFTNRRRKSITELIKGQPTDSLYSIVLNHQPFHLEEAEENHIDFQFSGHTHKGQVWPINLIVDGIYECGYGEWKRGNTRYYISSGIGIWGGKFRIGSNSEYVVAELHN